jgi:uncharacterized protein DUF5329
LSPRSAVIEAAGSILVPLSTATASLRLSALALLAGGAAIGCGSSPSARDPVASPPAAPPIPQAPAAAAPAEEPKAAPRAKETTAETIEHLLRFVADSKLTFIRNGQEHDSAAAADHMRSKYERVRGSVTTPEDFIEKAASRSQLSGKPYLVRLPDGKETSTGPWLLEALVRHRQAGGR